MHEIVETPSCGMPWKPRHPSRAAETVWLAFGAGDTAGWSEGALSWPSPERPDGSFLPGGSGFSVPDWVEVLIRELDGLLPPPDRIEAALGPDSLIVVPGSPGFLMPGSPNPLDAGNVLLAARILLALRNDVLPPVFSTCEECEAGLMRSSATAIMLGGRGAFIHAAAAACDPGTFETTAGGSCLEIVMEGDQAS